VGIEEDEELSSVPLQTALGLLYPNPFHGKITISYQIAEVDRNGSIALKIFDVTGRLVKQFTHVSASGAVFDHVVWDARDDRGRAVPAGIYFVHFETDTYQQVEKAILLR
ncbi:MAG: T9SS type A sorting domain-containing protein, partial [candidate division WOR-3 bacterium]